MKLPCVAAMFTFLVAPVQLFANPTPLELAPLPDGHHGNILQNDELWQQAMSFELNHSVMDQAPPRYRTVTRMLYDAEALYFEIMSYDDDKSQIRSKFGMRDQPLLNDDDRVSIIIDPTGHRKFGQILGVNAACVPYDAVLDEVATFLDIAPQFNFTVECAMLAEGWRVRMKLPFHELKYQSSPTRITLLVERVYVRETRGFLTSSPIAYFGSCMLCDAPQFILTPPPKQNRIKAVVETFVSRQDQGTEHKAYKNLGVTLSLPLAAGTRLDGTWRPDFSQLEDDSPYLQANNPFPLPRTENRPFFMEGNDVLFATLFASAQSRSIVSPDYGLKLLSRDEHYKFLILAAGDPSHVYRLRPGVYQADYTTSRSSSQNIMTRGSWNALEKLTLGVSFNGKQELDLYQNAASGIDLTARLTPEHRLIAQMLVSRTRNEPDPEGEIEAYSEKGAALGLSYDFTGDQTYASLTVRRTESGFANDLGFMPERGTRELSFFASYSSQLKKPEWALSDLVLNLGSTRKIEDETASLMTSNANLDVVYETDRWVTFFYSWVPMDVQRVDFGGELHAGAHHRTGFTLKPPRYLSLLECSYRWGYTAVYTEDSLGRNRKTSCRVGVSLGLHLSAEYSQDHDNYQVSSTGHGLDERLHNAILRLFLTPSLFIRLNAQQSRISDYAEVLERKSLSWVFGYQSIDGLAAYCGVNQIRPEIRDEPLSREYFAKLSFTL